VTEYHDPERKKKNYMQDYMGEVGRKEGRKGRWKKEEQAMQSETIKKKIHIA